MRTISQTKKMFRRKQSMKRNVCRFSVALMITSIVAAIIIPEVYKARGYMSIGGEWLLLIGVFALTYKLSM